MSVEVLCIRWGYRYSPQYVHKLKRMVERHLTIPHKFICITPRPEEVPDIRCEEPTKNWHTWWQIITLFNRKKPFLFFGLDTVIQGNIDKFVKPGEGCWGVEHWRRPGKLNSSVMWVENAQHVYKNFKKDIIDDPRYIEADQQWIYEQIPDINYYPSDWVGSCQYDGLDIDHPVIAFHGYPKPEHIFHPTVTNNWY